MEQSDERVKLLFVYSSYSSFVGTDHEILSKHYNVEGFCWHGKRDILRLIRAIRRCDMSFSWFASDHAAVTVFLSGLFGKPSLVVVGGYEVGSAPEINYGTFTRSKFKQKMVSYSLMNADVILPVSDFTKNEVLTRVEPRQMKLIYNAVKVGSPGSARKKEKVITTVGSVTENGIKLKGLDTFAVVSTYFPDYSFVIIGQKERDAEERLRKINPDLLFTGHIPHEDVMAWFRRTSVYCQLSYRESFGMSVAESMACECIPVVTRRGALPEVVGDAGYYVRYDDPEGTAAAVKRALASGSRTKARERIENLFSTARRERELVATITELMADDGIAVP